jgi:hypothetical protein
VQRPPGLAHHVYHSLDVLIRGLLVADLLGCNASLRELGELLLAAAERLVGVATAGPLEELLPRHPFELAGRRADKLDGSLPDGSSRLADKGTGRAEPEPEDSAGERSVSRTRKDLLRVEPVVIERASRYGVGGPHHAALDRSTYSSPSASGEDALTERTSHSPLGAARKLGCELSDTSLVTDERRQDNARCIAYESRDGIRSVDACHVVLAEKSRRGVLGESERRK